MNITIPYPIRAGRYGRPQTVTSIRPVRRWSGVALYVDQLSSAGPPGHLAGVAELDREGMGTRWSYRVAIFLFGSFLEWKWEQGRYIKISAGRKYPAL